MINNVCWINHQITGTRDLKTELCQSDYGAFDHLYTVHHQRRYDNDHLLSGASICHGWNDKHVFGLFDRLSGRGDHGVSVFSDHQRLYPRLLQSSVYGNDRPKGRILLLWERSVSQRPRAEHSLYPADAPAGVDPLLSADRLCHHRLLICAGVYRNRYLLWLLLYSRGIIHDHDDIVFTALLHGIHCQCR